MCGMTNETRFNGSLPEHKILQPTIDESQYYRSNCTRGISLRAIPAKYRPYLDLGI